MPQKRQQKIELQEVQIMAKASALATGMGLEGFKHSHGWFVNFIRRHGYKSFKLHGEANAADTQAVSKAHDLVPKLIENEVCLTFCILWLS